MSEYEDLARRVAALEAELAEAKRTLEASKPKEPFVPKPIPKPDWTEGMSMSGPAHETYHRSDKSPRTEVRPQCICTQSLL